VVEVENLEDPKKDEQLKRKRGMLKVK